MVAVVGGPAQRQLAQVARADHQTALHVGDVHQYLRALAGLTVFIGRRAVFGIESDVAEVLRAGVADRNFADRDAQPAHQFQRGVVGAVRGAEAGHGDADDSGAVESQLVERADRDEQGQRRIQSARNADYGLFAAGVHQPFGQPVRLYLENLLAAFAAVRFVLRHERHRVDVAVERRGPESFGDLHFDYGVLRRPFVHAKRGVAAAFEFQPLNVDIGHDELLFEPEASRFAEYPAVFGADAVAGEHQIGGRFAEACRAVDVSREGAGRLLGHELTQVGVLAHRFGRRREVEDHLGAVEREVRRRRNGGPEVLADFDAEFRAVDPEREGRAEVGALFRDGDRLFRDAGAGCEPAVFVELRIVGDVGLGYDAQHTALRENDGAVVERRAVAQGGAGDDDQRQFARGFYQPRRASSAASSSAGSSSRSAQV